MPFPPRMDRLRRALVAGMAVAITATASATAATIPVDCAGGPVALNSAVTAANGTPDPDTIDITGGPCTITYLVAGGPGAAGSGDDSALPVVTAPLTILGHGSTIARATAVGTPNFRLLLTNDTTVDVHDLTFTRGRLAGANVGAGIAALQGSLTLDNVAVISNVASGASGGGAAFVGGTVTVDHSQFQSNQAVNGGGIYSVAATTAVRRSAVLSNSATSSTGGALVQGGSATFQNDTFASNSAANGVGGITVDNNATTQGTATIEHVTFADNSTSSAAGAAPGGAIFTCVGSVGSACGSGTPPVVHVHNSIVTDTDSNAAAVLKPCNSDSGGTIVSDGGNLEWPTSTCPNTTAHADPKLAPVPAGSPNFNGGATFNYRLRADSPAIDLGTGSCPATDQRDKARPGNGGDACDTGAYETQPPQTTASGPTGPTKSPQVSFSSTPPGASFQCSLDSGSYAACSSPYGPAGLSDGTHTVAVRAAAADPTSSNGAVGNTYIDPSPAVVAFVVDKTPPQVTITESPSSPTGDSTPAIKFTAQDANLSVVQCQVDTGTPTACSSPFTPAALDEGTHTITVVAGDSASNSASSAVTFVVDTLAPSTADDVPSGYVDHDVAVELTATDAGAGTGVDKTYYTTGTDPDDPTTASTEYDPASKPVLGDGERIKYFSVDLAGNAEPVKTSAAAQVDELAPSTTDDAPETYQSSAVEVTLTATDDDSGVAATYYEIADTPADPTTASPVYDATSKPSLGPGQRIKYFSVDEVGHAEAVRTRAVHGPTSTGPPVIGGTLQSGQTLTTTDGPWTDGALEFHYRWAACDAAGDDCADVGGDSDQLVLGDGERGKRIRSTVTASNPYGSASSTELTGVVGLPVAGTGAVITGTLQPGGTLGATDGAWQQDPTAFAYRWRSCDTAGANCTTIGTDDNELTLTDDERGRRIRIVVTATNAYGSTSRTSSATGVVGRPVAIGKASISGTPESGSTLTAGDGTWRNDPTGFSYQWRSCDAAGANCTTIGTDDRELTLTGGERGRRIRVAVTATNAYGTGRSTSLPTLRVDAPVADTAAVISGTLQPGDTLSATDGTWRNDPTGFAYQWRSCDKAGANCTTVGTDDDHLALTDDERGRRLKVTVIATNLYGSAKRTSSATGVVGRPVADDKASISGTPESGHTLTATDGTWRNDPTGFAYRWRSCDAAGANCTAIGTDDDHLTLTDDERGRRIRVTVTATNSDGTGQSTSLPTLRVNAPVLGDRPAITGTLRSGQTLSATDGTWQQDPTDFAYQWRSCDRAGNCTAIGTDDNQLTLTDDERGRRIRVTVTATNSYGATKGSSLPTATVS